MMISTLAPGGPPSAAQEPARPLGNEDVVRMVAQGRPEAEILRIIAGSRVDFELDSEMTEELRRAGISDRILSAMRERQAVAGVRPAARPAAPAVPVPSGTLH